MYIVIVKQLKLRPTRSIRRPLRLAKNSNSLKIGSFARISVNCSFKICQQTSFLKKGFISMILRDVYNPQFYLV